MTVILGLQNFFFYLNGIHTYIHTQAHKSYFFSIYNKAFFKTLSPKYEKNIKKRFCH